MKKVAIAVGCALLAAFWALAGSSGKDAAAPLFREIPAEASGIQWVHDNAMSEERHLPETIGPGVVFFDFDRDGWMDLFFVNSGKAEFFLPARPLRNALYRNNGDGTFRDVTEGSGLAGGTYFGMGAAAGDFDGDGWPDIVVTSYDGSFLYRNQRDGTFSDVTSAAGLAAPGWSTCATWFDYDNDGKLDLFLSSFVKYTAAENRFCGDKSASRQHYCIPRVFEPWPSRLFHNNGDGTFSDVSQRTGIAGSPGKAFGAVATDVNKDGFQDLFVANDTVPNFLFVNRGGKSFEEIGLVAGVAYSEEGNPRSGMGVDAADFDQDGLEDLFVANIDKEMFSLYRNEGGLDFYDYSAEIRRETRLLSGWGLKFFDFDNDGDPDLFLANGHPDDRIEHLNPMVTYKMELMLFENVGKQFLNVSSKAGPVFQRKFAARGVAVGDYDNDGDLDVVVANNGGAPLLLRNESGQANGWVGLELVAQKSNPAAVGAVIEWEAGGKRYRRYKTGGGSFLASHDPREILGLGGAASVKEIVIRWPAGTVDRIASPPVRTYLRVVEGEGVRGGEK